MGADMTVRIIYGHRGEDYSKCNSTRMRMTSESGKTAYIEARNL